MKILLTGAFGNVGTSTLAELVKRNNIIRCFDVPTRKNKRTARKFKKYRNKLDIVWGEEPIGILIISKKVSESYKNYFELLWKIAKI